MNKFAAKAAKAFCALGLGLALASSVQAATTAADKAIIDRIKPVGSVCVEGDTSCGGAPVAAAAAAARSGEELYKTKCSACHASGVLGAPKFGSSDWSARLKEKGFDTLLQHALNGFNSMPPKGTCADCSDDEIKGAIQYMLDNSK